MGFCILEKDRKTFEYFKEYLKFLEKSNNTCLILDNEIQVREIHKHLTDNGFSIDDANQIRKWISENGKHFRDYLNTIKLVYVIWKCTGKEWKNISWDKFIGIEEQINGLKHNCLDTIF